MILPAQGLTEILRVLVDPTRLRILGLLELGELSVGELARALEMAQSRVSNHLRVLREAGLLAERHVGRTTFLRLAVGGEEDAQDLPARLWRALRAEVPTLPDFAADVARFGAVQAERRAQSSEFFDRVAGEWDKIGVDFATGQARQRAAASLLPAGLVVADLGCGTGYLARALVGLCARVIGVDRSSGMLAEARKQLASLPPGVELDLRRGELDALPIADAECDGALAGMVLHHVAEPQAVLSEMRRILKPGGRAVVLELAPHKEAWMHEELGDRQLGLDSRDVIRAFRRAGFADVRLEAVEDRYQPRRAADAAGEEPRTPALPLYIVRGRVPLGS